jgi:hypothetical protein
MQLAEDSWVFHFHHCLSPETVLLTFEQFSNYLSPQFRAAIRLPAAKYACKIGLLSTFISRKT